MRAVLPLLSAAALLASLAGCGMVTSDHPLSTDETAVVDDRLIGRWQPQPAVEGEEAPADLLYVGRMDGTQRTLEAVWLELRNARVRVNRLRLLGAEIGGHRYLSLSGLGEEESWAIVRYELPEADVLRVLNLKLERVAEAIESGELEGRVKRSEAEEGEEAKFEEVHVTSPPDALRAWLAAHAAECVDPEQVARLHRIRSDD